MISTKISGKGLLVVWVAMALYACGNQVAPTGGPRDTTPARVVKTDPPIASLNQTSGAMTFFFDEAVKPAVYGTDIFISPLPRKRPKIILSDNARKISINLQDDLLPNTTYVVTLTGVKNHHENMPMTEAFTLAFSTGSFIDSLEIKGTIAGGSGEKVKDFTLLLFDADSIQGTDFFNKRPAYITKIDSAGGFHFNYLRRTSYKVFAVKDADQSNTYNSPAEPVGIPLDTIITFSMDDTLALASIVTFTQDLKGPQIRSYAWLSDSLMLIRFSERPRLDWLTLFTTDTLGADTLPMASVFWLGGTDIEALVKTSRSREQTFDLRMIRVSDSLDNSTDSTLRVSPERIKTLESPMVRKPEFSFDQMAFELILPRPFMPTDTAFIHLKDTTGGDSVFRAQPVRIRQNGLQLLIEPLKKPEKKRKYLLEVMGAYFTPGADSDSAYVFVVEWPDITDYGTINGKVNLPDTTYQGKIVVQMVPSDNLNAIPVGTAYDRMFEFKNVKPGNYTFRVVLDADSNQTWTPGRVTPYRLPEKILVDKGPSVVIRANWDYEEYTVEAAPLSEKAPEQAPGKGKTGGPGAAGQNAPGTPPAGGFGKGKPTGGN